MDATQVTQVVLVTLTAPIASLRPLQANRTPWSPLAFKQSKKLTLKIPLTMITPNNKKPHQVPLNHLRHRPLNPEIIILSQQHIAT